MKILVPGGRGQLGRALVRCAAGVELVTCAANELDIRDPAAIAARLDADRPDVVINAAGHTAVDRAETERDIAFATNADGAAHLAQGCAARGIRMLHVSTDYVFDGAGTRPYREDDPMHPINVYGESKAAGELAARAAGATVVRTSWLFGKGGPSFVHTIVRLATERPTLRVVDDQHGCPTWADDLARALLALASRAELDATYHYCNAGETTWFQFATAVVAEARKTRALACERIDPITSAEYPMAARRPLFSVLDTSRIRALGILTPPWQHGLSRVLSDL